MRCKVAHIVHTVDSLQAHARHPRMRRSAKEKVDRKRPRLRVQLPEADNTQVAECDTARCRCRIHVHSHAAVLSMFLAFMQVVGLSDRTYVILASAMCLSSIIGLATCIGVVCGRRRIAQLPRPTGSSVIVACRDQPAAPSSTQQHPADVTGFEGVRAECSDSPPSGPATEPAGLLQTG